MTTTLENDNNLRNNNKIKMTTHKQMTITLENDNNLKKGQQHGNNKFL